MLLLLLDLLLLLVLLLLLYVFNHVLIRGHEAPPLSPRKYFFSTPKKDFLINVWGYPVSG